MTEGTSLAPSGPGITRGTPSSTSATRLLVVPRSIPTIFAIIESLILTVAALRKGELKARTMNSFRDFSSGAGWLALIPLREPPLQRVLQIFLEVSYIRRLRQNFRHLRQLFFANGFGRFPSHK